MVDISLDLNKNSATYNDILITNNDITLTSDANSNGANPVLQDILQRLRFYLGEWFLDNTQGIPWIQQILIKNPNISGVEAILMNTIVGTPGVTQLTDFTASFNTAQRIFSVSFKCITTQGVVIYSGNINPETGGQG